MDGMATFLLGGAVGVALGYLASRKRAHRSVTGTAGQSLEAPSIQTAPTEAPSVEAPPQVSAHEAPPVEAPSVEAPPVETSPQTLAHGTPSVEALPIEVPVYEGAVSLQEVVPEEVFGAAGVVEAPVDEEAMVEEGTVEDFSAEGVTAEAPAGWEDAGEVSADTPAVWGEEVIESPPIEEGEVIEPSALPEPMDGQVLEEAVEMPAAHGEVSMPEPVVAEGPVEETAEQVSEVVGDATPAAIDEVVETPDIGVIEEHLPWGLGQAEVKSESVEAQEPLGLAGVDIAEIEFVDLGAFETLKEEVAEPEAVESPFSSREDTVEVDVTAKPDTSPGVDISIEADTPSEADAPLEVDALTETGAFTETDELTEPDAPTGTDTAIGPDASLKVDVPAGDDVSPVASLAPVTSGTPPSVSPVDDLKARIEETRRRIRRELERPFVSVDEIEHTQDWVTSPVVPVVEESVEPQSVEPQPVEPQPVESDVIEPSLAEPEPQESVATVTVAGGFVSGGAAEEEAGEVADYASMKNRIEVTRSRLKAKAFDAMMAGESALLSREPEDVQPRKPVTPAIDSEIDQTIETSLREQED